MFPGLPYKMNFSFWFWLKEFSCFYVKGMYKVSFSSLNSNIVFSETSDHLTQHGFPTWLSYHIILYISFLELTTIYKSWAFT